MSLLQIDATKSSHREKEGKLKHKSEGTADERGEQRVSMKQAAEVRSWKDLVRCKGPRHYPGGLGEADIASGSFSAQLPVALEKKRH